MLFYPGENSINQQVRLWWGSSNNVSWEDNIKIDFNNVQTCGGNILCQKNRTLKHLEAVVHSLC